MGPRESIAGRLAPLLSLAAGAAAWEVIPRVDAASRFPPLSDVLATTAAMTADGRILQPLATSIWSLAIGFGAAAAIGVLLGLLIARSYVVEHMTGVYFDALMSAPTLIYVPVLFAAFGVTRAAQVATVFIYAFFIVTATTAAGVKTADQRLVEMARAFGASERQIFRMILLPAAAPSVLAGLRLGTMRAVKGMVVGEMIIALSGLGALLKGYGAQFDVRGVLAVLLVIVVLSLATNAVVATIGRIFLSGKALRPLQARAAGGR